MSSYAFLFFTSLQQQLLKYQRGGSDREIFISKVATIQELCSSFSKQAFQKEENSKQIN